jgi:rhodanese-related sulfurtransferase
VCRRGWGQRARSALEDLPFLAIVVLLGGGGAVLGRASALIPVAAALACPLSMYIGPKALRERLVHKDFVFVNVHVPYEGEIAQTDANIPYDQIGEHLDRLPSDRDAMIVLYCRTGHMSVTAAETLVRLGYTNIWNLEGGFTAWERAGFPFRKP